MKECFGFRALTAVLAVALWIHLVGLTHGANVTLVASDPYGASSFNTNTNWSNGLAPVSTNDYFTTNFSIRTPASTSSFTFAGRSLQIDAGGSMGLKTGGGGVLTIGDLRLAGGTITDSGGTGDNTIILAGAITVTASSVFDAYQGSDARLIIIRSTMIGASSCAVTIRSSGNAGGIVSYEAAAKAYSGNTTVETNGILRMGLTNAMPSGAGGSSLTVNGVFRLNGFDTALNGLSGTGIVQNSAVGAATLTVGSNNDTCSFGGVMQDGGTGTLALAKIGSGIFTMTSTNAYTGSTTISGGVLSVSHSTALSTNDIYLAGSGTLNLNFTGTITNTILYINGTAMYAGVYTSNNLSQITGQGMVRTLWPPPPLGTVILVE